MIKPVHEEDELDIDLVCRLTGKKVTWTQYDLKQIIGNRLKDHGMLKKLLDAEGRRCWTLQYAESARFHLDILPAIVAVNFRVLMEKALASTDLNKARELAIRITDKLHHLYYGSSDLADWLKSNPFGYAIWFLEKASISLIKARLLLEAVQPVPKYQADKLPLQRVVQICKRHRDMMFNGDADKPISMIITTLAGQAYQKQTNVMRALSETIDRMHLFIEERYDPMSGKMVKWICNPVNPEENFADKWPLYPEREKKFYMWLGQIKADLENVRRQRGMQHIQESLYNSFGKREVTNAFNSLGRKALEQRENGGMKMAAVTGILGSIGRTAIPNHNNFGSNE